MHRITALRERLAALQETPGTQGLELMAALKAAAMAMNPLMKVWPEAHTKIFLRCRIQALLDHKEIARVRALYPYPEGTIAPKPLLNEVRTVTGSMLHFTEEVLEEMDKVLLAKKISQAQYKQIEKLLKQCYMAV